MIRAFRKGSVIFEADGGTDMGKIREKLGGHIAVKAMISAATGQ